MNSIPMALTGLGLGMAATNAIFLAVSLMYGVKLFNLMSDICTIVKMKFFEGDSIDNAHAIWKEFQQKRKSLTGEHQEKRDRYNKPIDKDTELNLERLKVEAPERYSRLEAAAKTISTLWKKKLNSGDSIPFNPNGNHPDEFHTLLNVSKNGEINGNIRKTLNFDKDQKVLSEILAANYTAQCFSDADTHFSALNLFARGKIDLHQKTTVSNLIESSTVYGGHEAYPILDKKGNFSLKAKELLLPGLKEKSVLPTPSWTVRTKEQFRNLVATLPESERYFFVYPNQQFDNNRSHPYEDASNFSHELEHTSGSQRFLNKIHKNKVLEFILKLLDVGILFTSYKGVLTLSSGARDAQGLALYGKNWEPLIPRIGQQNIEDIEHFSSKGARPTISPESYYFGITPRQEKLHSVSVKYPISFSHDDYHRMRRSNTDANIKSAFEYLISLSRDTFGYRWSKDIWLLRDFDLGFDFHVFPVKNSLMRNFKLQFLYLSPLMKWLNPAAYHTVKFSQKLAIAYLANQLENCYPHVKRNLTIQIHFLLFDHQNHPSQILQLLILDMVMNPEPWAKNKIQANPGYFPIQFASLINMAKFLNKHNCFEKDNMKANIIKFNAFIKSEGGVLEYTPAASAKNWHEPKSPQQAISRANLNQFDAEKIQEYDAVRNNKSVFLGFIRRDKKKEILNPASELRQSNRFVF